MYRFQFVSLPVVFLAFSLLCSLNVNGQESTDSVGYFDVVYLKDGTSLEGIVKKYDTRTEMVFQLPGGTPTMTIPSRLVERIVRGSIDGNVRSNWKTASVPIREGVYQICSGGLLAGTTAWAGDFVATPSLDYSVGYFLSESVGLGLGTGIHIYSPNAGEVVYPLFAEVRARIRPGKPSLYLSGAGGYGFAFPNEARSITNASGGILVHPAIGLSMPGKTYHLHLDVGVRYQEATWTREFWGVQGSTDFFEQSMKYTRFVIRFGMMLQ